MPGSANFFVTRAPSLVPRSARQGILYHLPGAHLVWAAVACFLFTLVSPLVSGHDAAAQTGPVPGAASFDTTSSRPAEPDSLTQSRSGWLFLLPVFAYTPETKFMFGATTGRYYRLDDHPDSRPSTFTPTIIYTSLQQTIIWLPADLYWSRDNYHATGSISFTDFPTLFYGIGNDTPDTAEEEFTPRTLSFEASLQKIMIPNLYVGARYEFATSKITEREAGGLLDSGLVPGSDGGRISGLGAVVTYDSRDDIYFPITGTYIGGHAILYDSVLGSDYDFTKYGLDARKYLPLGQRSVLALQAWGQNCLGDVPFQSMPELALRGYFEGRFRDNTSVLLQAEYRQMVVWRLGFVVFGGVGQVAGDRDELAVDRFRSAYGVGFRFQMGGEERVNIRLDYGWGEDSTGMYLLFAEAF